MEIIIAIVALAVGFCLGFLLVRGQKSGADAKVEMLERQVRELQNQYAEQIDGIKKERDEQTERLKSEHSELLEKLKSEHSAQIENIKAERDAQLEKLKNEHSVQLEKLQNAQKEQLDQSMALLREQFKTSAEQVLKERSNQLADHNKEQLATILDPLKDDLQLMKQEVEKDRKERSESMVNLKSVIDTTLSSTRLLGERADNLANALTRDNKYQGNFGELRLSKMLEDMGFERGRQFEEQVTLRDDEGHTLLGEDSERRMQPDVVLHFPDNRDIIIDSKVSMTAFERYANAKTEEEKQAALQDHVASVRNQVKLLTQKSYWKQYNQRGLKLDFVVMFMFSESALQLALSQDTNLWHEAYEQGVLITGGQNLYALLRILEISWKQMAQVENQQKIMEEANNIVARAQLFYERFLVVEEEFQKVQNQFNQLKTTVAPTGQSIITSANKLLKYGAKEDPKKKRSLPKE